MCETELDGVALWELTVGHPSGWLGTSRAGVSLDQREHMWFLKPGISVSHFGSFLTRSA